MDRRKRKRCIKDRYGEQPETLLSHEFFMEKPDIFYDYLRKYLIFENAQPNKAHLSFAALEKAGKLLGVVTQNIDGLDSKAGTKAVYELHGSVYRSHCMSCGKKYGLDTIMSSSAIPKCTCGGIIKPDVVLYGEGLNEETVEGAIGAISKADMMIVAGTSLAVYPAAGLIDYFEGNKLVLINKSSTPYDSRAQLRLYDAVGKTMDAAMREAHLSLL